jgi:hypothetical protein
MKIYKCLVALSVAAALWCFAGTGKAGGDKKVWQPVLPPDVSKELLSRSATAIEESIKKSEEAKDEDELKNAQFQAVLIAAITMSTKGNEAELAGTRQTALELAKIVTAKGKLPEAKKLAAALAAGKGAGKGAASFDPKVSLEEDADLMNHFKTKAMGGEGIHPDLQVNIRLKGTLNGIEEKIRALAMKKMMDATLVKAANELGMLGYRMAVEGQLIHEYAPAKKIGTKDPKEWRELSLTMREASLELVDAAKKKDAEAVLKAGNRLNSACNQCHSTFRTGN